MKKLNTIPKMDGFRMPAEFEEQKRIWMIWPERSDNWRDGGKPAQSTYRDIAIAISREVPVDENKYLEGLKYVVKDKNTLSLEKAVFLGWSEENPNKLILTLDEETALVLARPEAELTIGTENVEYYAVWAVDNNGNAAIPIKTSVLLVQGTYNRIY